MEKGPVPYNMAESHRGAIAEITTTLQRAIPEASSRIQALAQANAEIIFARSLQSARVAHADHVYSSSGLSSQLEASLSHLEPTNPLRQTIEANNAQLRERFSQSHRLELTMFFIVMGVAKGRAEAIVDNEILN